MIYVLDAADTLDNIDTPDPDGLTCALGTLGVLAWHA